MAISAVEKGVWEALAKIIDPELDVGIVDLGLIYEVEVDAAGECLIKMSLTTPGCPLSSFLQNDIEKTANQVEGVNHARVQLVWYPVWSIARMSAQAKEKLGIGGSLHERKDG